MITYSEELISFDVLTMEIVQLGSKVIQSFID